MGKEIKTLIHGATQLVLLYAQHPPAPHHPTPCTKHALYNKNTAVLHATGAKVMTIKIVLAYNYKKKYSNKKLKNKHTTIINTHITITST